MKWKFVYYVCQLFDFCVLYIFFLLFIPIIFQVDWIWSAFIFFVI